eukprot:TRINITY_DN19015_c0_g1_i1.p1 TRINITY_DN19015_c0_g1~~TRINITY_DN19015_c0_g1_i1.p1  ORF type:complete len:932 (+),score=233.40 TRINITY_DN19015_c0_g1_i1:216-2798(+)
MEVFVLDFDALQWRQGSGGAEGGGPSAGATVWGAAPCSSSAVLVLWSSAGAVSTPSSSILDLATMNWIDLMLPQPVVLGTSTSVSGSGDGYVLVFGGSPAAGAGAEPTSRAAVIRCSPAGDWECAELSTRPGTCPPARAQHAAASGPTSTVVVHGGTGAGGALLGDLWVCDLVQRGWSLLDDGSGGAAPCPRRLHAIAASDGAVVLHGGFDADNAPLADLWSWDVSSHRWRGPLAVDGSVPHPRAGHLLSLVWPTLLQPPGPQQQAAEAGQTADSGCCYILYGGCGTPGGEQLHDVHRLLVPPQQQPMQSAPSSRRTSAAQESRMLPEPAPTGPSARHLAASQPLPSPWMSEVSGVGPASAAPAAERTPQMFALTGSAQPQDGSLTSVASGLAQEQEEQSRMWGALRQEEARLRERAEVLSQAASAVESERAAREREMEVERRRIEEQRLEVERQVAVLARERQILERHSCPGPSPDARYGVETPPRQRDAPFTVRSAPPQRPPQGPVGRSPPRRASPSPSPAAVRRSSVGGSARELVAAPVSPATPSVGGLADGPMPSVAGSHAVPSTDEHMHRLETDLARERARVGDLLVEIDRLRRSSAGSSQRSSAASSEPAAVDQPSARWPAQQSDTRSVQAEDTSVAAPPTMGWPRSAQQQRASAPMPAFATGNPHLAMPVSAHSVHRSVGRAVSDRFAFGVLSQPPSATSSLEETAPQPHSEPHSAGSLRRPPSAHGPVISVTPAGQEPLQQPQNRPQQVFGGGFPGAVPSVYGMADAPPPSPVAPPSVMSQSRLHSDVVHRPYPLTHPSASAPVPAATPRSTTALPPRRAPDPTAPAVGGHWAGITRTISPPRPAVSLARRL